MNIETTRDALTELDGYETSDEVLRAIAAEAGGDVIDWARGNDDRDCNGEISPGVAREADRIWREPTADEKKRVLDRLRKVVAREPDEPLCWGNHDVRGEM